MGEVTPDRTDRRLGHGARSDDVGYWRTRTFLDREWGVMGRSPDWPPSPGTQDAPVQASTRIRAALATLGFGLVLLAGCAYEWGPARGTLGDAALCTEDCTVTWDGCRLTFRTERGRVLWTGPLSAHGLGALGIGALAVASPTGAAYAAGAEGVSRVLDMATEAGAEGASVAAVDCQDGEGSSHERGDEGPRAPGADHRARPE